MIEHTRFSKNRALPYLMPRFFQASAHSLCLFAALCAFSNSSFAVRGTAPDTTTTYIPNPAPTPPKPTPTQSQPTSTSPSAAANFGTPPTDTTVVNSVVAPEAAEEWNEQFFYLFAGLGLGASFYSAYDPTTPGGASLSGFHADLQGLAAFYFNQWVLDAGLGFNYLSSSGTDPNTGGNVNVITRGGYLEVSPRYRITRHWQIGPVVDFWYTTDDGLNANALANPAPTNTSLWLGLQPIYEWMIGGWKYRLGGKWETSIGVTGRSVNTFQGLFQVGFPLGGSSNEEIERPIPRGPEQLNEGDVNRAAQYTEHMPIPVATPWSNEPNTLEPIPESPGWVEPTPTPALTHTAQEKFTITLDIASLPFETDSARLPRYHRDRLKEIGRFLAENPKNWRSLTVAGHTDERGAAHHNKELSKARALTVRQLLMEGGAPAKKIKAVGYGQTRPRDKRHNAKAWKKNRRVEFEFHGVKDVLILNDGVAIKPMK